MSRTIRNELKTKLKGHTKPELRKTKRNSTHSEMAMLIRTQK